MLIFDVFHNMLFLFHVVVLVCKLESTVLERHDRFFSIWSCSTHNDANSGVSKFRSHNNIQWVLSSKYNERAHQNLSQTLTFLVWSLDLEKEKEKKKQISLFSLHGNWNCDCDEMQMQILSIYFSSVLNSLLLLLLL